MADEGGHVAGFAYAAPWKARSGYRHSVEITVYLGPDHPGRGIGSRLHDRWIDVGYWQRILRDT